MQIAFKHHEIAEAMRQYVIARGFKLDGQAYSADFSMGKGKNKLSVVVTIEDMTIPGYTGAPADDEEDAPPVEEAAPDTVAAVIAENVKAVGTVTAQMDAPAPETVVEAKEDAPAAAAPEVATAGGDESLFD